MDTITGHHFNFIGSTLDVVVEHEQFKIFYIVMDNVSIHKHEDITRYVVNRGFGCVYLPPYSSELNPIKQFWSVVKSKLKRKKLVQKETLNSRISVFFTVNFKAFAVIPHQNGGCTSIYTQ